MDIEWPLVVFTLLTGAGGWMLACAAANEFIHASKKDAFKVVLIALIVVIIGGFASVLHLTHPDRILNALSRPTSGIFVEAALVGVISVCAIVQLICYKRNLVAAAKVFAVLSGTFGIVISFMAGDSYVVMNSHPAWYTLLLPLAYLATAAPMGCALYWAVAAPDAENGSSIASKATAIAGLAGLVVTLAYGAFANLFSGDPLGYVLGVIVFDAAAAALGFAGVKKANTGLAWGAVICALIAGLLLRMLMWVAGTTMYGFMS